MLLWLWVIKRTATEQWDLRIWVHSLTFLFGVMVTTEEYPSHDFDGLLWRCSLYVGPLRCTLCHWCADAHQKKAS